jgi:uncharacterized damage-inducible protein DinB
MDVLAHFRMLARYNRLANERLFEKCAQLDDAEYHKSRPGSFGGIHANLSHILRGDRIWMERFEAGNPNPPSHAVVFEDFAALRSARIAEDARIEQFFSQADAAFFDRPLHYSNLKGEPCTDPAAVIVSHLFNHQTHHRGQVHVMLSQTPVGAPTLDLHRIMNP